MVNKNDPHYKGEKTPKHLKHGPLHERRCTDVLCLLIFVIFWGGIISVSLSAFKTGDPEKLTFAYDKFGNQCGQGSLENLPYLYFVEGNTPTSFALNNTVCIDQCPTDPSHPILNYDKEFGTTAPKSYASSALASRFCLPVNIESLNAIYNTSALNFGFAFKAVTDLKAVWWMIVVVGVISLILGFIYLVLMKYFAGLLIWSFLILFVAMFAGIGVLALEDSKGANYGGFNTMDPTYLKLIAGVCFTVAFISFALICCFRSRINLAIAVMKAAADFVEEESQILLIPPIFFVMSLLFYVGWVLVAVYIMGTNDISPSANNSPLPNYDWNDRSTAMMAYHVFALFWNHAFFVALSQFVICSSACLWYFKQGTSNVGASTVWTSIKRAFLHLGSIAFGSFLIGLLDFVRAVLNYFNRKLSELPVAEDGTKNFCIACCECCLTCFQKSLQFLNRHAYIQIAMTGENFCKATEDAFHLLLRNALRFGTVHTLAWIFTLLGQLVVSIGATFLGYLIITQSEIADKIYSPVVPTIIFFLSSFIIAHVFMSIYGMSADTIIHCFAMDEEIHDGHPCHAPQQLRDFVDEHVHKGLLCDDE